MTAMVAGISKAAVEREAAMMEASSNFIWARKLRALRAALDKAEAERDRLREALEQIEIACEEEIRARTAGMSEAALGKSRILPLLQVPRNIARAALKGESHE